MAPKSKSHKLFNQLAQANVTDDEISELYEDLRFIYDNSFDLSIEEAIVNRGCTYIEVPQSVSN